MNIVVGCLVIMLTLLLLSVPVFASIISGVAFYFAMNTTVPTQIIAQRMISGVESIPLLAIPFFVCAGIVMNYSGITKRVMDFCVVLTRRMYGGLAQVNVLLSTLMGGMSGSNLADAAMEAKMLVPEMEKAGFSNAFSSVVTATSSIITPLIPPSIGLIIYGSLANISIGKLFVAGISPGLLLCLSMMILVTIISKKRGYQPPATEPLPKGAFWEAFKKAAAPLCMPVIIIGSIRCGICTATEAGSVAILYSFILGIVYRELNARIIFKVMKETVITTAGILLIVSTASSFGWVLTKEGVPQFLANVVLGAISNKYVFMLIVNFLLLIMGMFMEGTAIQLILVPLLAPIAVSMGIDPIHFAIAFAFNLGIGCLSPPLGTVMFVTCGITKCKIKDFVIEAIPFYIMAIICLLLLIFVEPLSLFFVNLIY
ncbi:MULTISPECIES: TRAP transporter large permease [Anaerotruncus]|uniref:TRAP transporter large permease n=1 Tax=Anaerotruncus TaxID=244127 RepID=UPI00082B3591|nr:MULTISPECIES: TRAP transporter large permease [Anaerotruncus]RGX56241.1 TRAP transporter large permease [Anaerotruncus sp. AF02-27]